jgi:hypothetical protein
MATDERIAGRRIALSVEGVPYARDATHKLVIAIVDQDLSVQPLCDIQPGKCSHNTVQDCTQECTIHA